MEPTVELQSGLIRGIVEKHDDGFDYYSFKGIPYAEPPIGELRFKDPIPKKKWSGVLDCKNDGPMCLQNDFLFKFTSYEEECLHLNVFSRSINQPKDKNPVLVIVHAGAHTLGSNQSLFYGPDYLIRKDVVLVMPNYRLGVLGFLDLEDEVASGNQGMKDLVLALHWVQQNIRTFGGNPGNVTLFGTVGSSSAVHLLALSPLTKGLVHKVISGCNTGYSPWSSVAKPKSQAIELCSLLGKNLTDSNDILEFLKSVDSQQLQEAQELLRKSLAGFPFLPGVDSKSSNPFMPIDRYTAADQGVHLPYLVGYNSHESSILLVGSLAFPDKSKEDYFKQLDQNFGLVFAFNAKETLRRYNLTESQVRRFYYKNEAVSTKNLDNYLELTNDFHIFEGIHRFARVQSERSSAATYLYQFSYAPERSISEVVLGEAPYGRSCGHYEEMSFMFRNRNIENKGLPRLQKGTPGYRVMEQVTEMWTNFAKYGKPTVEISELIPVHWKHIADGTVLRYLNIDEDITMQTTINIDQKFLSVKDIKV